MIVERRQQAETGTIPPDWEEVPLRQALKGATLGGNYPNTPRESANPLIKMGNVGRGSFDVSSLEYIPFTNQPLSKHRLKKGDVLFNTRNTLDLVGKVAIWRNELPIAYFNSNLLRLDFDSEVIDSPEYANLALNSYASVTRLRGMATGTTSVAAIYTRDLMNLPIVVPTKPEQKAIVEALSGVDTLIESLNRLITKKRDIKKAMLQQLLTGKRRLPGFQSAWTQRRLGDLLRIRHGKGQRDVESESGAFPILGTGGLMGFATRPLYDRPSVLIGRKGTIDRPMYMDRPFWTVDTLFYSEVLDKNSPKFLYYSFCLIDWKQYNEASGVPSLNSKTIENIEIPCPLPEEQAAIASTLSDIDAELLTLQTYWRKVRDIKQGMMQQLLTGRVRLI